MAYSMKKENTYYCTTFSIKRDIVIDRVKHHNLSDKPMIRVQVIKLTPGMRIVCLYRICYLGKRLYCVSSFWNKIWVYIVCTHHVTIFCVYIFVNSIIYIQYTNLVRQLIIPSNYVGFFFHICFGVGFFHQWN